MPRPKGSKNRLTDAMRRDIMSCYRGLGGRKWLLQWARENETEFVKQALSRLMPPAAKPDEEADQRPIGDVPPIEIARRLAFVLTAGAHTQEQRAAPKVIEAERVTPAPPPEPERVEQPEPADPEPEEQPFIDPETRQGSPPFRESSEPEPTLATYYGSGAEHAGPGPQVHEMRVERRPRQRRKLI